MEKEGEYVCIKCGEEWCFSTEDYNEDEAIYPDMCPLCSMPLGQFLKETYKAGGLKEVIVMFIKCRLGNK